MCLYCRLGLLRARKGRPKNKTVDVFESDTDNRANGNETNVYHVEAGFCPLLYVG